MSNITPYKILKAHNDTIRSLDFSPDGAVFASLSILRDPIVKIWDTTNWEVAWQFHTGGSITNIIFSPQGETLIGSGIDSMIYLWNIKKGTERIFQTNLPHGEIFFTSSGNPIIVVCHGENLVYYDLETQSILRTIAISHSLSPILHFCGWISPDMNIIAVEVDNHVIQIWDLVQEKVSRDLMGHVDSINDVAFRLDENLLVSGSDDGTIKVWDVRSGISVNTLNSFMSCIMSVLLRPYSSMLAAVNEDEFIELWDITSGICHAKFAGHGSQVVASFSPDGKLLASGSDDCQIRLWAL